MAAARGGLEGDWVVVAGSAWREKIACCCAGGAEFWRLYCCVIASLFANKMFLSIFVGAAVFPAACCADNPGCWVCCCGC